MPWKASSVVDERARFVFEQQRGLHTMTELCAIYAITRETGYYWLRRYQQGGLEALSDRHRAPRQRPNQTPEEIAEAVLELRRAHMSWGLRKLKRVLEREQAQRRWPAASTIGTMVAREGLVVARRKRRRVAPYTQPFASADAPNRVWCADFNCLWVGAGLRNRARWDERWLGLRTLVGKVQMLSHAQVRRCGEV